MSFLLRFLQKDRRWLAAGTAAFLLAAGAASAKADSSTTACIATLGSSQVKSWVVRATMKMHCVMPFPGAFQLSGTAPTPSKLVIDLDCGSNFSIAIFPVGRSFNLNIGPTAPAGSYQQALWQTMKAAKWCKLDATLTPKQKPQGSWNESMKASWHSRL